MAALVRLDRYLARLPRGIGSYPECEAKASACRHFVDSVSLETFPFDQVPRELAASMRSMTPHTAWVPDVHFMAAVYAIADHRGMSDASLFEWVRERNASLLAGRTYRMLMAVASPSLLLHGASRRWGTLHRGTHLEVLTLQPTGDRHGALLTLRFPANLFDETLLRCQGNAFLTAVSMSRGKRPTLAYDGFTPRSAVFRISWT